MHPDDYSQLEPQIWERLSKVDEVVPDDTVPPGYVRDETAGQIVTLDRWLKRQEKRAKKLGMWPQMKADLDEARRQFAAKDV